MRVVLRAREKSSKESARAGEKQRERAREKGGRDTRVVNKLSETLRDAPFHSRTLASPVGPLDGHYLGTYLSAWHEDYCPFASSPFPSRSRGLCRLPRPASPPSLSLYPLYPSPVSSAKATPAVAVLLLEVLVSRPSLPSLLPLLLLSYAALGGSSDTTARIAANGTRERRMRTRYNRAHPQIERLAYVIS